MIYDLWANQECLFPGETSLEIDVLGWLVGWVLWHIKLYWLFNAKSIFKQIICSTLTKRLEKKLDGNYTRMLRAILNKSWRQHPTRHQLYGHLPPITKTIQVWRTRHAGHCWRSRDELIRDVLLWTPTHGRARAGRPTRTYIQQLCEDTGCCLEDLPREMNDREEWRERVRDIRATSAIWWWWWWWFQSIPFNMNTQINCQKHFYFKLFSLVKQF